MTDATLRTTLVVALLAMLGSSVLGQSPGDLGKGNGIALEPLPEPRDPFRDREQEPQKRALTPLNGLSAPAVDTTPPMVAIPHGSLRPDPGELQLPALPELPDIAAAILNPPSGPTPSITLGAPSITGTIPALSNGGLGPQILPEPADPNALIAMMPPRVPPALPAPPAVAPTPQTVVPAPRQILTPAPPVAPQNAGTPPAAHALAREGLDQAFAALGQLQALPPGVVQAARVFYEKRADQALWSTPDGLTSGAAALLATVTAAESQGLSRSRFRKLEAALAGATAPESREAATSLLAIAYARDARGARLNPLSVSRLVTATTTIPEPGDILASLAAAGNAGAALAAYNPQHAGFVALRQKLAEIAAPLTASAAPPRLTFGPVLTRGMSDPRVAILRETLGLPASDSQIFDAELSDVLRAEQRARGLKATGRLDRATTAALGGVGEEAVSSRDPRADIIANMERWRWLPTAIGDDHVFVNIPDFTVRLMRGGREVLRSRVVVGKPETQTPIFSHKMQFLVVNPSWNVPPSITMKEYLPMLQRNPMALAQRGLQVISNGKVVDPASVDWSKVGRSVAIRQPPGERNALGHIKFMFPNQHAVYLHDTPSRALFANDRRAYSHGCVRVQDPFRLAEAVMGADWPERRLRSMVGGGERQINLPAELPVHLVYFTTFVDEAGSLQTREDLYGHNRRVKALLGL